MIRLDYSDYNLHRNQHLVKMWSLGWAFSITQCGNASDEISLSCISPVVFNILHETRPNDHDLDNSYVHFPIFPFFISLLYMSYLYNLTNNLVVFDMLISVYHAEPEFFDDWFSYYTLGKKGCYTPIEDNRTNVDRTFVFPLG